MSETSEMIRDQIATMNEESAETAPETAVDETNQPPEGEAAPEVDGEAEKPNKANKEAAKYRTQLREAEGKLEAAQAALDVYRSREVTELVGKLTTLETAEDYFAISGTSLADYLTDTGTVDTEKVQAAVVKFRKERPNYRPKFHDPTQGFGYDEPKSADFSDLFRR